MEVHFYGNARSRPKRDPGATVSTNNCTSQTIYISEFASVYMTQSLCGGLKFLMLMGVIIFYGGIFYI